MAGAAGSPNRTARHRDGRSCLYAGSGSSAVSKEAIDGLLDAVSETTACCPERHLLGQRHVLVGGGDHEDICRMKSRMRWASIVNCEPMRKYADTDPPLMNGYGKVTGRLRPSTSAWT